MKLNFLLIGVVVLSASCSSFQGQASREVAAVSSGDVRDYQSIHEDLTLLLSTTFIETDVVTAGPSACNVTGGATASRYASQAVLDKIAYLQARVFAQCGNDCEGKILTQQVGLMSCGITVVVKAPRLNPFQEKIQNLLAEQPANYHVFAAYASMTPIGACNSKGVLYSVSGVSTYQNVLDNIAAVKEELQKKCGDSCNIAINFSARNETECIVTGVATLP